MIFEATNPNPSPNCSLYQRTPLRKLKLVTVFYVCFVKETELATVQRKLLSAEDQLAARPDEELFTKNRKLMSLIDKYKTELTETYREIRELKSRLLVTADAKVCLT